MKGQKQPTNDNYNLGSQIMQENVENALQKYSKHRTKAH